MVKYTIFQHLVLRIIKNKADGFTHGNEQDYIRQKIINFTELILSSVLMYLFE